VRKRSRKDMFFATASGAAGEDNGSRIILRDRFVNVGGAVVSV